MNGSYKWLTAVAGIAAIIGVSIYLYIAYLSPEAAFLRLGGTTFWTGIQNESGESLTIKQGETKTFPVELHYWKRLDTLLAIKFEEPEAEHGGLYNPPDGLEISFNLDSAYVQVANEKVVEILNHKDVKLKEPSQIEYRFEGLDMVVAEEIGNITISVSNDVPVGDYYFGIATTDARVNSPYDGHSQLLVISVVASPSQSSEPSRGEYPVTINGQTYDIDYEISFGHVDRIEVDASVASFVVFLSDVNEDGTLKIHFSKEIIRQLELAEREHLAFDGFLVFIDEIAVDASWENSAGDLLGTIPLKKGTESVEIIGSFLL